MKFRGLLAVFCALGLAAMPAAGQQPIVIKFSHVVAVNTPKGKGAEYFKKLAEERTNGRVKVEVYPNSALFKDGEEMEALQLGSVQMLAPSVSKFGPLGVREFEVFDLPYMFDSYDDLHKVGDGPVGVAEQMCDHEVGFGLGPHSRADRSPKPIHREPGDPARLT